MKYTFVMPYFHRPNVFKNTLDSFVEFISYRDDYEILIMEADRNHKNHEFHEQLIDIVHGYKDKLNIKIVRVFGYTGITPAVAYNYGSIMAKGSHLLFTQPEIKFLNYVLDELDDQFKKTPDSFVLVGTKWEKRGKVIWKNSAENPNGENYPFTIAMTKESYIDCSYDLVYAAGFRHEDTDWRDRLRQLDKPFVITNKALVLHQAHGKAYTSDLHLELKHMIQINKNIYRRSRSGIPNYKTPPICEK